MAIAWRLFWRDWRSGEMAVLFSSLVLAVTIVSTLGLFVERLQKTMEQRSAGFQAADLVLNASRRVDEPVLMEADALGLEVGRVLNFQTMAFAHERMQLTSVKAVSPNYPLVGDVEVRTRIDAEQQRLTHGPVQGEAWADPRLLSMLDLQVGDVVSIGNLDLKISAILDSEPDAVASILSFGPRLMMSTLDVEATGVVQPGSRIFYSYLFTGDEQALQAYQSRVTEQLQPGQRFINFDETQPRVARTLARARSFMLLAGSLGVVLAGVALAMASRRYAERHADYVAILKTLGLRVAQVRGLYAGNLLLLAVLGIVLGWTLGYLLQGIGFRLLGGVIEGDIPAPGFSSLWLGAGTGLLALAGFSLPALFSMSAASPLRVLRREGLSSAASRSLYVGGALAFLLMLFWYSGNPKIGLVVFASVGFVAGLTAIAGYWLLRRGRLPGIQARSALRLAMAGLQRHAAINSLQVMVFAMTIMLLLLMSLVRTALIDDWQTQLPENTPNHFLINISEQQVPELRDLLRSEGLEHAGLYPRIPGRLMAINGEPVEARNVDGFNIDREMSLTWSDNAPEDNSFIEGQWWDENAGDEVSVEQKIAEALGLGLGDRISISVGADTFEAEVTSIRSVQWDRMRPNFYFMFPRRVLQPYPGTWFTSVYIPPANNKLLTALASRFPTVSVLDMDALIEQVRGVTGELAGAIELVLLLLLVAGGLVMMASVQSGLDERFRESGILRALGASRRLILGSLTWEFALLGLLAGVLATIGAEGATWYVQGALMQMTPRLHPQVWMVGPLSGALLASVIGLLSTRRVVNTPPISVLREL